MKRTTLILICFVALYSYSQPVKQKLFLEFSPLMIKAESGLFFTIHGRIDYQFNKLLSLSARYNQNMKGFFTVWSSDLKPNPYKKSSFSELVLGITLFNTTKSVFEKDKKIPTLS